MSKSAERWAPGEVSRLRRHLEVAREKYTKNAECEAVPDERRTSVVECKSMAEVAHDFGASAREVREVLSRADRIDAARCAKTARDTAQQATAAGADIYALLRGAIIERLEKGLHPHAPWRDPREPWAPGQIKADPVPFAHTLAAACVWLRHRPTGQNDVSADLLWCVVMRGNCASEAKLVRHALTAAWLDMHAAAAVFARTPTGLAGIERAAAIVVAQLVTGIRDDGRKPVRWELWRRLEESGQRMLWALADHASRRVVDALR